MTPVTIECLRCGKLRRLGGCTGHAMESGSCPRCGYVGWAVSDELSEHDRRELRDHPVEVRGLEGALRLLAFR